MPAPVLGELLLRLLLVVVVLRGGSDRFSLALSSRSPSAAHIHVQYAGDTAELQRPLPWAARQLASALRSRMVVGVTVRTVTLAVPLC